LEEGFVTEHARKSTRASVDLIPRYRSPTSFDFVEGRCIDLSEGGMFIVAQLPCESGTLLKFECEVAGSQAPLRGIARVVWKRHGEGQDRPSGMGLKFVKLEEGSHEAITKLVAEAQSRGTKAPELPLPAQIAKTSGASFPPGDPNKPGGGLVAVPSAFPGPREPVDEASSASGASSDAQPSAASIEAAPASAPRAGSPAAPAPEPSAGPADVNVHEPPLSTTPASGARAESSGAAIWIALAVGGSLLAWLLMRG
jgi:uncharacterized protein (TIGR02266 family)